MNKRPPIVVIMGSVDHGKTTLLDYIRKANVAAKEAGGITQSVGAYEIVHGGRKITFIDTPGHEAFSQMKTRGAKIADVAILVVATDDSVQPQTKAAIKIIQESKTPMIVAINKIDKVAETEKVKNDLMQAGVLMEGYGGDVSNQPISAKTGEGVDDLLDLILLASDMETLEYDPVSPAKGLVLESKLDRRRGIMATLIVKDGTLKMGDEISAGKHTGKIRMMENFLGEKVDSLEPSAPAIVVGFETLPPAGTEFYAGAHQEVAATKAVAAGPKIAQTKREAEGNIQLVLKADVSGSLEALSEIIKNLPLKADQRIEIISEGVGDITDGDVKHALSTKSIIIGFRTRTIPAAATMARANGIKIVESEIIYDLTKAIEETLFSLARKAAKGKLEILALFSKKGTKQVIGGKVTEGQIINNAVLEVDRNKEILGTGKIVNLQQGKRDAKTVEMGLECGLIFDCEKEIKVGDILVAY
ncbi:MAG: translation initiation factor IF-2 [bacterium]|nr:translation initiation factor IF-2 [bacterium]